ncbi:YlmC/YmxH family sporulation protein [Caloranaerobacter azorensis H53214]|uniref:YlmC/YmxH family sporulation protein n=1 Tax=Caloranaerobacter azorensis H53214 TaxID=1156417 RepID=A0A096BGG3_9FIRM|nr:YlmC/YmxH family sporulation protein [Caloranaerobacter azorensis]KGG80285.1 YlmC/YmxH family sporulation protein [Caloranaerobacter azorensis H53214]
MRLSKLGGKEIVNLNDGGRLGMVADSDLVIDEKTGKIKYLIVPDNSLQLNILRNRTEIEIPWESIRKIGNDMIIIELDEN